MSALGGLASTIEVVDKSGKVLTTGKSLFGAFKDAKAAYHARKQEILAERAMERAARDGAKLAILEKEARRAERAKKRLEHQKRVAEREERKAIEGSKTKAIEWKEGGSSDDKKKKEKRESSSSSSSKDKKKGSELVVYGEGKDRREKEKDRKHKKETKDKKRKDSTSSSSGSSSKDDEGVMVPMSPPTPPSGDDFDPSDDHHLGASRLHLPYNASMMTLAQTIHNVPAGGAVANILNMAPQVLAMIDPDGDSPLSALLIQLTNILDTLDCLNASMMTLMASLQKDPDALAMVGLTLAEIAAIVAKTAPSVIMAAKAAFPFIFALLASPQFLVTAGAGVIILGGYKIIRRVTGGAAPPSPVDAKKEDDHEDGLAYGAAMDEIHEEVARKRLEPKRTATAPAVPVTMKELPPTPPSTPPATSAPNPGLLAVKATAEEEEDPKSDPKTGKKRQVLKRLFTV